jgi:hypothetical protein
MDASDLTIFAYEVSPCGDMPLTTAPVRRDWMDATDQRFAYRCLPLAIANQAGWLIHCPASFRACWDGGPDRRSLAILPDQAPLDSRILSHFGSGIITFSIPYLFRTPASVNLWVKGPSNFIKDGVQALEGVVETDWLPATFTMNWKLTRPGHEVHFERGEPICMVVPQARGLAECLVPVRASLASEPVLQREYEEWSASRDRFLTELVLGKADALRQGWQKDYTRGLMADGRRFVEHQTQLQLKEFSDRGEAISSGRLADRRSVPLGSAGLPS